MIVINTRVLLASAVSLLVLSACNSRSRRHRSWTTSATFMTSPLCNLFEVGLVAPRPVGRLLDVSGPQHVEDAVEALLVHDVAHADQVEVAGRHPHDQILLCDDPQSSTAPTVAGSIREGVPPPRKMLVTALPGPRPHRSEFGIEGGGKRGWSTDWWRTRLKSQ